MTRGDDGKDLLAVWQEAAGDGQDPLQRLVEVMLQGVLEAEMSAFLKAGPHERTAQRRGYRNGHQARTLTTRVGKVELQVPPDRGRIPLPDRGCAF